MTRSSDLSSTPWLTAHAIVVAILSLAGQVWSSGFHSVTESHEPWEEFLANAVFYGTLGLGLALPALLVLARPSHVEPRGRYPRLEIAVFLTGLGASAALLYAQPDGTSLVPAFLAAMIGYARAVRNVVSNHRAGCLGPAIGNMALAATSGLVVLVVTWTNLFFE